MWGFASHNLFTIAYAYLLSRKLGSAEYMTFEMLEGMADHVWRAQSPNWENSCDFICTGGKTMSIS